MIGMKGRVLDGDLDYYRGVPHSRTALRLLVVLAALAAPALLASESARPQSESYRLRLSSDVGQTNRYRLVFDIQMRAEYGGSAQPDDQTRRLLETLASGMGIRTAVEYEQRLIEVSADGTRTFEVHWRDFDFSGEIGGRPIPPPPLHVRSTRELLSQRALVRTTPTGRTKDVAYDHPGLAELGERYKQLESAMPTYLPEESVRVGDSWTGVAEFPLALTSRGSGTMTLQLEHRLVEIRQGSEGPLAVIQLAGSYSRLRGLEEFVGGAPQHMEASLTGSTLFDINGGRFVGGHYEIDMFALHAEAGIEIQLTGHANGDLELVTSR